MKIYKFVYPILVVALLAACSKEDSMINTSTNGDVNLAGSMARFAIAGKTMYCVTESTLNIYDLTNPSAPVYVNKFTLQNGGVETIFARDSVTLFIGTTTGMYILDVTNAAFPSIHTQYAHVRSCDPVVADNQYAYVTLRSDNVTCGRGLDQLEVIDIKNLSNPMLKKTYMMISPHGLAIQNNRLMVCDGGLKVFDKTNPENLIYLSGFEGSMTDIIPLDSTLITVGADGFKQFRLVNDSLTFVSSLN